MRGQPKAGPSFLSFFTRAPRGLVKTPVARFAYSRGSEDDIMNFIWRFYRDQERLWRWQRLSTDKSVIAESQAAYNEYEGCLASAQQEGYIFEPAQPGVPMARGR